MMQTCLHASDPMFCVGHGPPKLKIHYCVILTPGVSYVLRGTLWESPVYAQGTGITFRTMRGRYGWD